MSKFCKYCGNQLEDEAVFCNKCGNKCAEESSTSQPATSTIVTQTVYPTAVPTAVSTEPPATTQSSVQEAKKTSQESSVKKAAEEADTTSPNYAKEIVSIIVGLGFFLWNAHVVFNNLAIGDGYSHVALAAIIDLAILAWIPISIARLLKGGTAAKIIVAAVMVVAFVITGVATMPRLYYFY